MVDNEVVQRKIIHTAYGCMVCDFLLYDGKIVHEPKADCWLCIGYVEKLLSPDPTSRDKPPES